SDLPSDTVVYCGHEYTLSNAQFALTVDPDNEVLQERARKVEALRADNRPPLPTTIGEELATNPFLRWADPAIRAHLGMQQASSVEFFAEIRRRKDKFSAQWIRPTLFRRGACSRIRKGDGMSTPSGMHLMAGAVTPTQSICFSS